MIKAELNLCYKIRYLFLRGLVKYVLKFHNFFYGLAGLLSQKIEPNGIHPKQRLIDYHQWFISQIDSDWTVLDVGCGNGALAADVSRHCRKIISIDISSKNIEKAKKYAGINFICADVTKYHFEDKFDAVIISNVLEHIEDRIGVLKNLKKCSKRFLIRAPLINRDWITLYKRERGVDYRLDKTHYIEYTEEILIEELSRAGLEIISSRVRYGEIYCVAEIVNNKKVI